jgi:hypothetical protein
MAFAVMATMKTAFQLSRAAGARGAETVQLGHLDVHQHVVEVDVFEGVDALPSVVGDGDAVYPVLPQLHGHLLIHGAVLGQQPPAVAATLRLVPCTRATASPP